MDKIDILQDIGDINSLCKNVFKNLVNATKSSNALPGVGDDYDYYSSFGSFRELMTLEGRRILSLIQSIMRYHGIKGNVQKEDLAIDDRFDMIIDLNDQFLERIGNLLDEAAGLKKEETPLIISTASPKRPISGSWNKKKQSQPSTSYRLLAAKIVQRPQKKFKENIDNSRSPFIPKIKFKPNALQPLPINIIDAQSDDKVHSRTDIDYSLKPESFPHPYQYELESFIPSETDLLDANSVMPLGIDDTPLLFVKEESKLIEMVEDLKKEVAIAVDIEAHTYRSYQGISCLIQISTRSMDYLIDVLSLRSEMHLLNVIFTDAKIVKVLHGSDNDIIWLQRDFGLYIVNLFDTGQAARILNFPRFSLAYLLQHFCQVEADKQYQLADWRMRPLPDELIKYAREDTHYLLYIYDKLKKLLLEKSNVQKNLLISAYQRSTQISLKVYEKPQFNDNEYLDLYRKQKVTFNNRQLTALERILAWRDETARAEDESLGYVLPNHMLLQICQYLPKESHGIVACCNPIPPLVRQYLPELFKIVTESRYLPLETGETKQNTKVSKQTTDDVASIFDNPHDLSWTEKEKRIPNLFEQKPINFPCNVELLNESKTGMFSSTIVIKAQLQHINTLTKVEAITKSIYSPLDLYLSNSGLFKKTSLSNVGIKERKWKLLPNTPKEVIVKKLKNKIVPSEKMLIDSGDEEQGVISLNQIIKVDKKRKSEDLCSDAIEPDKMKCIKLDATETPENFTAYDYKKIDYSFFEGENHLKVKRKEDQKFKSNKFQKNAPKMTVHSDRGKKTHSFGIKQPNSNSKWPKK